MKKNIEIFIEKIKHAKSIAVSGHKNPDGDSLCSALAIMKLINLNFKKHVTVIYDGNIPRELENVPSRKTACFYKHVPENSKFDSIYSVIILEDKTEIPIADIIDISGEVFKICE